MAIRSNFPWSYSEETFRASEEINVKFENAIKGETRIVLIMLGDMGTAIPQQQHPRATIIQQPLIIPSPTTGQAATKQSIILFKIQHSKNERWPKLLLL